MAKLSGMKPMNEGMGDAMRYESPKGKLVSDEMIFSGTGRDGEHHNDGGSPHTMAESHGMKGRMTGPDDCGDGSGHFSGH